MAKFKIKNLDQGEYYYHTVEALDRNTAIENFKAGHYGTIVECEEIKPKVKCPHCGKEI